MTTEIILLENIHNLGKLGDKVKVKPGYRRNYLIPQGKAVSATPENIAKFESRRAELEKVLMAALQAAQARAKALEGLVITIAAKAGEEGKLFGSLGTIDLANAITAAGVAIVKSEVHLPEGPLRMIGEYDVLIQLHADVDSKVKVVVIPEA